MAKFAVLFILFISWVNGPALVLAFDQTHSVSLSNEHGVLHLVFFHAPEDSHTASPLFSSPVSEENHEFHITASTGLIQKKSHAPAIVSAICEQADYIVKTTATLKWTANLFEADVGLLHSPPTVLRI